ncbi:hypothetical protein [Streptomyces marianii]|uniref:Uncharacterized protein n=1 Tax=Streptomyces marianii TaxID=1817406 RepID=A0A5R9DTX7_9ACTN|nr:hypothetical protein [Streptomyces marianii]TLQ39198.1 hypothetical protein FEF34_38000 [Streptomyces marianii]
MPITPPTESAPDGLDDTCGELVSGYDEDGPTAHECGAPLHHTENGYTCSRGHSYTYAACRAAEGWDYASDPVEAELLARAGVIGVYLYNSRPLP